MPQGIPIQWDICLNDMIAMYKAGKGVHFIQKYLKDYYGMDMCKSAIHNKLKREGVKSHQSLSLAKKKIRRVDYEANKELILKLDQTKGHGWIAEQIGGTRSGVTRVLRIWRREEEKKNES
jgi:GTP-sensing pleiotropic transcriptional regulator CodY